jgi:uncharacterized protein YdeI (YjbR/CyaY-like superfamily)
LYDNQIKKDRLEKDKLVYFTKREDWRNWLKDNFDKKDEVWFIFPKKNSDQLSITYNDAVEEALCFDWIDSTVKKLDNDRKIQRFTPRKTKSNYSQPNIERLKWLLNKGMIHPSLNDKVKSIVEKEYKFPSDIIDAIKKDNITWENYQKFTDGYKRIRVAYIDSARTRQEDFNKRLKNFIAKTKEGKRISGYGGIEKYY